MKSSIQVVLTETSIVVLSRGVFQTSIPLRQWSTCDGSTWSGQLRQGHQIEWLIGKLNDALNDSTSESTMQRIHRALADPSMPPRLPPRRKPTGAVTVSPYDEARTPPEVAQQRASRLRQNPHARPAQSPRSTAGVSLNTSA